jgi:DNA repair exonuclease SbcCD ATPase subunit
MQITKLTATGLKAGDFSHELGPVNVIVGDNFRGKTARLEAARLALMGYLPELGNKPAATFQLARGAEMGVSARLDETSIVSRSWKSERGSVKAVYAGTPLMVPPVLLDSNEYFSLGAKDQMRYVFSRAQVDKLRVPNQATREIDEVLVVDAITAKLRAIVIPDSTDQHRAVIQELITLVEEGDQLRHDAERPVQEWLEGLVAEIREKHKTAKQSADRMAKTVQGLVAIRAQDDEVAIQNVERQIKATREEMDTLTAGRAVLEEAIQRAIKNDAARVPLVNLLNQAVDYTPLIEAAEKERAELAAKAAAPQDQALELEAKERLQAALQQEADAYRSCTQDITTRLYEAKNNEAGERQLVQSLEVVLRERAAKHEQDLAAKSCPHCGAKAKGWQKTIKAEYQAWLGQKQQELDFLITESTGMAKIVADYQGQLDAAQLQDAEQSKRQQKISALGGEIRNLRQQQDQARANLSTKAGDLDLRIRRMRDSQKAVDEARAKLAGLAEPATNEEAEARRHDLAAMKAKQAELATTVQQLEDRQRQYHQAKQDEKRNAQSLLEHKAAQAEVQVLKEAVGILEALQGEIVKQAFGTILERANKVTRYILIGELEYRDGEIGRFQDGTWIPHSTFSGAEKALCYAGISVALAWDSPIRIILLDELSRFDHENLQKVLERMQALIETGHIHQFIGAGTKEVLAAVAGGSGVNVIQL